MPGRYSHVRVEESQPEHLSLAAGPLRGRMAGSGTTVIIVALIGLIAFVLWLVLGKPTDAQVTAQSKLARAELERDAAKLEAEQMRKNVWLALERHQKELEALGNRVGVTEAAIQELKRK